MIFSPIVTNNENDKDQSIIYSKVISSPNAIDTILKIIDIKKRIRIFLTVFSRYHLSFISNLYDIVKPKSYSPFPKY
ncbi:MAG: hypothetical protein K2N72_03585, partial [Oscillospiraceae bacterium]|nr:hypothetical protein [Oscillospiraceae bacterium]